MRKNLKIDFVNFWTVILPHVVVNIIKYVTFRLQSPLQCIQFHLSQSKWYSQSSRFRNIVPRIHWWAEYLSASSCAAYRSTNQLRLAISIGLLKRAQCHNKRHLLPSNWAETLHTRAYIEQIYKYSQLLSHYIKQILISCCYIYKYNISIRKMYEITREKQPVFDDITLHIE